MHKAVSTHINAGMGGFITPQKNDQIASANLVFGHPLSPGLQPGDGSWCGQPRPGLKDMAYQAAAVKAAIRRIAAVPVGCADQSKGINGHIV